MNELASELPQDVPPAPVAPAPPASPVVPVTRSSPSRIGAILRQPMTKLQTVVGFGAGLVTIAGTITSLAGLGAAIPSKGEVVAVVQDRARKPLAAATVEILTPQDALVTTLTAEQDGRVVHRVKEGRYRLRVTHPQFAPETRQVEVHAGERSEIRVLLARPATPSVKTVIAQSPGSIRKFFRELGF